MIVRSRDLGTGHPRRAFGSALTGAHSNTLTVAERITERTLKPLLCGPCKSCGERRFICDCPCGEDE